MKILKAIRLDKYRDSKRYTAQEGFIYKDSTGGVGGRMGITTGAVYCVTLYTELEEGDSAQYPLEDILDQYSVNCTDVMEEREEDGKHIYIFEIEAEDLDTIRTIAAFVGKRAYNYEEKGSIKLAVE